MSAAGPRAVLIDALGTLVALAPPGPMLVAALRERHGIELDPAQAERAFAHEMGYYREHHQEARDERSLLELRARCALVLAAELPERVIALGEEELVELLLASLHFSAQEDAERTLQALRESAVKVIVVSNWDCSLPAVLGRIGLAGSLDGIVTSGELGVRKPDPLHLRGGARAGRRRGLGGGPRGRLDRQRHPGCACGGHRRGAAQAPVGARPGAPAAPDPPEGVPVISSLDELANVIARSRRLGSVD